MKLNSINIYRSSTTQEFVGTVTFTNQQSGAVQVDLDLTIVDEMLLIYDKAISGLAEQIANQLEADSVKRKAR
jgi:hypothetical protein